LDRTYSKRGWFAKRVIEGRMEGERIRGRPRLEMLDDLIMHSYVDMKIIADDKVKWRNYMPWTCH
jgi:hypothetical protein